LAISNQYLQNADINASAWRVKFHMLWSISLLLKLFLAWRLQLFGDEAFYALEAAKPAWVYSDLPGMTAWLIRGGLELCGYHVFSVRLPFVLMGAVVPFLIIRIARHFSGEAYALQAGLMACCLPLLLPFGFMALPDGPLCLAALLCLDAAFRLLKECKVGACLQLAIGLVIGASTHYRFLVILLAGAVGFILAGGGRHYRNPRLLLALMVGACAWLPLFLYNLHHDLAGWQFQFYERNPWQFSSQGLSHLPIQAIVTTPILYVALLWCFWPVFLSWRAGEKKMGIILGAAGTPIVLFAGLAFFVDQIRTSFHWPLQAYFPLIAVLPFFLAKIFPLWKTRVNFLIIFSSCAGVLLTFSYFLAAATPAMAGALAGKKTYPDNFVGWNEISTSVRSLLAENEILVADNFMLAAELHFALAGKREVYVLEHPLNKKHGRARQLQDWRIDNKALLELEKNTPVLVVIEESTTKEWLRDKARAKLCEQFNDLKFVQLVYGPGRGKSFSIFRAKLGADPGKSCDTRI
jgi:4-amino-4-deoxy-L-arabinose transferase-like glycosyltransferase